MTPLATMTRPEFSPEFVALVQRRRDVSEIEANRSMAPAEVAAMWAQLADDYEDAGYPGTAETLRTKARKADRR